MATKYLVLTRYISYRVTKHIGTSPYLTQAYPWQYLCRTVLRNAIARLRLDWITSAYPHSWRTKWKEFSPLFVSFRDRIPSSSLCDILRASTLLGPNCSDALFGSFGTPTLDPNSSGTLFGFFGTPTLRDPNSSDALFGFFGTPTPLDPNSSGTLFGFFGTPTLRDPNSSDALFGSFGTPTPRPEQLRTLFGFFRNPTLRDPNTLRLLRYPHSCCDRRKRTVPIPCSAAVPHFSNRPKRKIPFTSIRQVQNLPMPNSNIDGNDDHTSHIYDMT